MSKIIGYKIKDSSFDEWRNQYEKYNHICTFQEFLEYYIHIPTRLFEEYFDKNKIIYKKDFNPTIENWARILSEIIICNDIKL